MAGTGIEGYAQEVAPEEAQRLVGEGAAVVDVREPEEYAQGHLEGSFPIPLADLPRRVGELPDGRTLVVVCRAGHRSYLAAQALSAAGFPAVTVEGGLEAWQALGEPLVRSDGQPGIVA